MNIEKYLNRTAVSITVGFSRILKDAVRILDYTVSD